MYDKLAIAKTVTKFVAQQSCGFVVGSVIKNNTSPTNKVQQAEMVIGAYVLGSMIGVKAGEYAAQQFDVIVASVKQFAAKESSK